MPNDYYSDAAPPPESKAEAEPKEEAGDSQTAVLPMAVFPKAPKVGDHCTFEVTQVNEDGAVVKYASEKDETEAEPETKPAPEMAAAPAPGGGGSLYE
jgi:exosome complex RNA-binding protein Csl4